MRGEMKDACHRVSSWTIGEGGGAAVGAEGTVRSAVTGKRRKNQISTMTKIRDERAGRTPCSPIHRTLLFRRGGINPFEETVHVEDVPAFSPYYKRNDAFSKVIWGREWRVREGGDVLSGLSSPGILQAGQQPS